MIGLVTCELACGGPSSWPEAAEAEARPMSAPAAVPSERSAPQSAKAAPAAQEIPSVLTVEHEVDVLARYGGVVKTSLSREGQPVRQGAHPAQLDDRTLRAELAHDQDDLSVAQDNVKGNQAELKAKQANYRRKELRRPGLSREADPDKAKFETEGAQDDLKSWESIVKRTTSQIQIGEPVGQVPEEPRPGMAVEARWPPEPERGRR
jgi:multidrug efflux pump subunit AcrA (membrane-fusion protein)